MKTPPSNTFRKRLTRLFCCVLLAVGSSSLGQEVNPPEAPEPPTAVESEQRPSTPQVQVEDTATDTAAQAESERSEPRSHRRSPVVVIGKDGELRAGDRTEAMVVIGGSAIVHGQVDDAVVAIGGDIIMKDGSRTSEAVAVLGGIIAESGSTIEGEAIAVGGKVDVQEGGRVAGEIQDVDFGGVALPQVQWLRDWFRYCVLMVRPLAPQIGWLWLVPAAFFLFYLLIAAAFPRPVGSCVDELMRRPATTFALGLLTLLLVPLIITLLAITGFGLLVVPFILAAVVVAAIVGKVALLQWIGLSIGRPFNTPALSNPLIALLVGSLVLVLLYMIPIMGLLIFLMTGAWALGAAAGAAFGGLRREMPARNRVVQQPSPAYAYATADEPAMAGAGADYAGQGSSTGFNSQPSSFEVPPGPSDPLNAGPATPPLLPEVLAFPKAGFWERLGAGFLDIVLVIILGNIVGGMPQALVVALAYYAGIWAWKATSIGGIVLGLKVVRLDGGPVTFAVALVRALAGAFSIVVLFLGFLWIAWDKDRQSWHDKIAGTVVIKLPRGTPLV